MNRSTRTAAIAATSLVALVTLPSAAFAGTKARTTCTESFARWHNSDIPQPEGGYVTIDFGNNGVDYTTAVWESEMVGLGQRFSGDSIIIRWYDASGTLLKVSGNGVPVTQVPCEEPTTTTVAPAPTEAPTTTAAPLPTEAPETTAAPETTLVESLVPAAVDTTATAAPAPTSPETSVVQLTADPPTVPASTLVSQAGPTTPTTGLPVTGPVEQRNAAIGGTIALLSGLFMLRASRRRAA